MLYTLLQTLAISLTLESAIFLVRGNFMLSAQSIAELSGTYWGYNPHLFKSLSRQTVDTRAGAILLIFAFALQMIALWKGPQFDDIGPANRVGLSYGIALGIIIFVISWWSSSIFAKKTETRIEEILSEQHNTRDSN